MRRRRIFRRRRRYGSMKRTIRRVVNKMSETKYYISPGLPSSISSISWTYLFPFTDQGVESFSKRVGRKIAITSIQLHGTLQGGQSNLATDDKINSVRIICANFRLNGLNALSTVNPFSSATLSTPILKSGQYGSYYNKIFYSKVMTLSSPGPDSTGYMPAFRRVHIKILLKKPIIVTYSDNGYEFPNQIPGIAFLSDSALAPNPGFTNGFCKFTYKDI